MKILIVIIVYILTLNLGNAQWINQFTTTNSSMFNSINFSDTVNGIATGYYSPSSEGRIYYTSNGGLNWLPSILPDSIYSISDSKVISSNLYYACGALRSVNSSSTNYYGSFIKSTNKGITWNIYGHVPPNIEFLEYMDFLNINYGFVSGNIDQGNVGALIKTTSGGQNWEFINLPTEIRSIYSIKILDSLNIIAVGTKLNGVTFNGIILKSTNAGNTWTYILFPSLNNFTTMSFTNSSTGFAAGNLNLGIIRGAIYKTTNSGLSWIDISPIGMLDTSSVEKMEFLSNGVGLLIGGKLRFTPNGPIHDKTYVLKTTDFGNNWRKNIIDGENNYAYGLEFLNTRKCFLGCGYPPQNWTYASIYYSSDGGETFIHNNSNEIPENYVLEQNYPNPFNPITNIDYKISQRGLVLLSVFDISGREIKKLINEIKQPGNYSIQFDGANRSSGIYFYRLQVNQYFETKKMILLK